MNYRHASRSRTRGNQSCKLGINLPSTIKLSKMNMSYLSVIHVRGIREVHARGRDTLRKVGLHDIKKSSGVSLSLEFNRSCQGINFFGLLHSGLIRKTNQDNVVCYTLTSNIE